MSTLPIILPIFIIALLGYVLAQIGFFRPSHIEGLTRYVFYVAIPVLLFNAMSTIAFPERIEWAFFFSYYGAVVFNFVLGSWLGRLFGYGRAGRAMFGLGGAYSNLVLIGLPVVAAGYGDDGLLPMLLIISIHSATLFSLTTILAESGAAGGESRRKIWQGAVEKIVRNPIIVGLAAGLLFNALALNLPAVLENTVQLIRGSALPCALFVVGASLSRYKLAGQYRPAAVIVVLKMAIMPLLVLVLTRFVFEVSSLWSAVAITAAGLPVGINVAVFAINYDAAVSPVTTAVLVSTALSIGTMALLLALLIPTI